MNFLLIGISASELHRILSKKKIYEYICISKGSVRPTAQIEKQSFHIISRLIKKNKKRKEKSELQKLALDYPY